MEARQACVRAEPAARSAQLPFKLAAATVLLMFFLGLATSPFQVYLSAFLEQQARYPAYVSAYAWRIIGVAGMGFGLAMGTLADRMTLRHGMTITCFALAGSCLSLLGARDASNHLPAYAAAALFGASYYSIYGLTAAYIGHLYAPRHAALVFALGNVAVGLGGIAGNILGGALKARSGSFEPVYLLIFGAAAGAALVSLALPSDRASVSRLPATGRVQGT